MTYRVVIANYKGTFPLKGLNDLLGGRIYNSRTKKYHNPVKAENDEVCRNAIRKYLHGVHIDKPIQCTFWVYAKDKRHDRGNLCSATEKSFYDAMQLEKVIANDGWDDVLDSIFHTSVCKNDPRIEVEIEVIE